MNEGGIKLGSQGANLVEEKKEGGFVNSNYTNLVGSRRAHEQLEAANRDLEQQYRRQIKSMEEQVHYVEGLWEKERQ